MERNFLLTKISETKSRVPVRFAFALTTLVLMTGFALSPVLVPSVTQAETINTWSNGVDNPDESSTSEEDEEENILDQAGDALAATGEAALNLGTHVGLVIFLAPVAAISFVILAFTSFLLALAGILFNWSVAYLVFNFGAYFGNSTGLLLAWGILRDFGNIILLFGFVYMGIQTILNINHFDVGKTLSRLVIFAVLLNFSLFITEAIIDATNGLTAALYSQTGTCSTTDFTCLLNTGIAAEILDRASLLSALGYSGESGFQHTGFDGQEGLQNDGGGSGSNYFSNPIGETLKFLGLSILITTAFVTLLAATFLLLSRAIHLTFLMVVSPIGFAGMAVPWLEDMAKSWWDSLIKQAMFAPVFLLLLFVSLKLLDGLDGLAGQEGGIAAAIQSPQVLNTGPLLFFALIIGFMIGSMLVSKKFGIFGAEMITKTALGVIKKSAAYPFTPWRDMAGGVAKNAGKRYNVMAGDTAKWFNDSKTLKAIPFAKPILGAAGAVVDDAVAGGLKGVQNIKVAGTSFADRQKAREEREKAGTDALRKDTLGKNLKSAIAKSIASNGADTDDLERVVNNDASVPDLLEHKAFKGEDDAALGAMARAMSYSRFKQVMDSKDVSEETKSAAREARYGELNTQLEGAARGDAASKKKLKQWSGEELAMSGVASDPARLRNLVHNISNAQYKDLSGSSQLGRSMQQKIKDLRMGTGAGSRFENRAAARNTLNNMAPADITEVPGGTLTTQHVLDVLKGGEFMQIARGNKLDPGERAQMQRYIADLRTNDPARYQREIDHFLYNTNLSRSNQNLFRSYFNIP